MKPPLKNILLGKYSLLVIAVLLYSLSFFFNKLYSNRSSVTEEVKHAENYLHRYEVDFNDFLKDTALIDLLLEQRETFEEFKKVERKSYSILLYAAEEFGPVDMRFWNDQSITPSQELLIADDGVYFSKLSNGYYFTVKRTVTKGTDGGKFVAYAMILVRSDYFLETPYLPRRFAYSEKADKRVFISEKTTEFPVKSSNGTVLFYLDKKATGAVPYNDISTVLLRLSAVLFLLLFMHLMAESIVERRGAWRGIGFLTIAILAIRLVLYYFPSIFNLRQFELFDPGIYGASSIHRSLGDLFINAGLFCWIILFAWAKLHKRDNIAARFSPQQRKVIGVICLLLLVFSTFILAAVIKSLVADSKISFDVTDCFGIHLLT